MGWRPVPLVGDRPRRRRLPYAYRPYLDADPNASTNRRGTLLTTLFPFLLLTTTAAAATTCRTTFSNPGRLSTAPQSANAFPDFHATTLMSSSVGVHLSCALPRRLLARFKPFVRRAHSSSLAAISHRIPRAHSRQYWSEMEMTYLGGTDERRAAIGVENGGDTRRRGGRRSALVGRA